MLTASKFVSLTEPAFLSRYGQIYRALPFLEGRADQNAARLHQLHVKHGATVLKVINEAIGARATLPDALDLHEHSLLAMVQSPVAKQLVDFAEAEPSASLQARIAPVRIIERPIRFAVDGATLRVLFPSGVKLTGVSYRLVEKLRASFEEDRARNLRPQEHCFTDSHVLANLLGISEPALRQNVRRLRRSLGDQFGSMGISILADDVIQNDAWRGYRLNPYLAPMPAAHFDESLSEAPRHSSKPSCHNSAAEG